MTTEESGLVSMGEGSTMRERGKGADEPKEPELGSWGQGAGGSAGKATKTSLLFSGSISDPRLHQPFLKSLLSCLVREKRQVATSENYTGENGFEW